MEIGDRVEYVGSDGRTIIGVLKEIVDHANRLGTLKLAWLDTGKGRLFWTRVPFHMLKPIG